MPNQSLQTLQNSVEQSKSDIQMGSKSFAFASAIFSRAQRESCWRLYAWCRRADDAIDNAASPEEAQIALRNLESQTTAAFRGENVTGHPWAGLKEIARRHQLPEKAALDMLRGFAFDVGVGGDAVTTESGNISIQIQDEDALLDYCYCVAGTVGLLMCPIMGVRDPEAARSAVALGSAMQLTNIARDIKEDYERGRIYLPLTWLNEHKVAAADMLTTENRRPLFEVVRSLLELAEDLYVAGEAGLRFLPWRAAWAVQVAAYIYRDIGRKVLARGPDSNYERVVVGRGRKLVLFLMATADLAKARISALARGQEKRNRNGLDIISS